MTGAKTREAQIVDGTAKVPGDPNILKQLASTMVDFDPHFEIMPSTKATGTVAHADPYEAVPRQTIVERLPPPTETHPASDPQANGTLGSMQ